MKIELIVFGSIAVVIAVLTLFGVGTQNTAASSLPALGAAPELAGISGWLNSEPLTIASLEGKVVLVDFWTYSCINCIRTLPYLKEWHEKYKDKGLVIIGVHTPEFAFEKDYGNVKAAVERHGIRYAVAQDNDYATWRAFKNKYWPRKYLIDKNGTIRYDHIGEGGYEETEAAIIALLKETTTDVKEELTNLTAAERKVGTPELYLGYDFARAPLGNGEGFAPGQVVDYQPTQITKANTIYLLGQWRNEADRMIAVNNSKLFLIYSAKDVHIVAGGTARIRVKLDDHELPESARGADATQDGIVHVAGHRLYTLVSTPESGAHLLTIEAEPGFELYTFTFG